MGRLLSLFLVVAALAAVAVAGGASAGAPDSSAARTRSVTVGDDFFRPRRLTISRRDTVRFVWRGTRNPHNVTASGRASRTTSRSGYVYRRRFARTTRVVCTIHPDRMRMTIRVR